LVTPVNDSLPGEPDELPVMKRAPVRAYEVELTGMASGESRRVVFAFHAADYGRHRGYVAASRRGDIARALISTFVLP
jgi:hypothetical protein